MHKQGTAERLYSPEVLGLAVALADFPLTEDLPLSGSARSDSCGSTLEIGLLLNSHFAIERLGIRVTACAIGQASAALFASYAKEKDITAIQSALTNVETWLVSENHPEPWPGLNTIGAARAYPARHAAILLPWRAALGALSKAQGDS